MKKRYVTALFSLLTAAVLTINAPASLRAQEQETEAAKDAEEEQEQEETAEDFVIPLEDGDVGVKNQTAQTISEIALVEVEDQEDEKKVSYNLELTEEGGQVHTFEDVDPAAWKEPVLFNSYEFLYIRYQDAGGKEQEAMETAKARTFPEPLTMYVSANVHIRQEADKESQSLKVAQLGEEYQVTGALPGWFQVESGDVKGYAFHSYLTEDKEAVDALVKAKKEQEAAAQQAAAQAAAAQQAAAQQAAAQQAAQAAPQAKTEVSRQAYDDCDGSGHGYYEITWSDGSVTYEEY